MTLESHAIAFFRTKTFFRSSLTFGPSAHEFQSRLCRLGSKSKKSATAPRGTMVLKSGYFIGFLGMYSIPLYYTKIIRLLSKVGPYAIIFLPFYREVQ